MMETILLPLSLLPSLSIHLISLSLSLSLYSFFLLPNTTHHRWCKKQERYNTMNIQITDKLTIQQYHLCLIFECSIARATYAPIANIILTQKQSITNLLICCCFVNVVLYKNTSIGLTQPKHVPTRSVHLFYECNQSLYTQSFIYLPTMQGNTCSTPFLL